MFEQSYKCLEQGLNVFCMSESDFGLSMGLTGILVGFAFMISTFLIVINVKGWAMILEILGHPAFDYFFSIFFWFTVSAAPLLLVTTLFTNRILK